MWINMYHTEIESKLEDREWFYSRECSILEMIMENNIYISLLI